MATFLIDHPSREIGPVRLLQSNSSLHMSFFLDFQDYYFGSDSERCDFFKRLAKDEDFILAPSYNVIRTPLIALRSKLARVPLVVYHSEQFYKEYLNKEKLNLDHMAQYLRDVHFHLVWGDYYKNKLLGAGIPENRIFVVGNWKEYLASAQSNNNSKEHIEYDFLFLSNFVLADYGKYEMEVFREQFSLPSWYDPVSYVTNNREGMIAFIERLASTMPKAKILVRRHPGESIRPYESLARFKNIQFSKDGALVDDLRCSQLILTQDSTSIFECDKINKPYLSVAFGPIEPLYRAEPEDIFDLHDSELVFSAITQGSVNELFADRCLARVGVNHYINQDKSISDLAIALDEISKCKVRYSYDLRFFQNALKLLFKYVAWKLAYNNIIGRFLPFLRRRLDKSETAWLNQDHYFE